MRFKAKIIILWILFLCVLILVVTMPGFSGHLSKAALQDLLDGDAIPGIRPRDIQNVQTRAREDILDPLVSNYGENDLSRTGENGRGVVLVGEEKDLAQKYVEEHHVNVLASDLIPLNRIVPDSRHPECRQKTYDFAGLPNVTVTVPFYNEWRSLLLRTVYSVINRTPPSLLREVILVDDASTMEVLLEPLDTYIREHFPGDLVRIVRQPERKGLIQARLTGWREAKGEVLVFLDSHMEMAIEWLPPLLLEIQKNKKTVAMSILDYIDSATLQYNVRPDYIIRYGFNWKLTFFEFYFRPDQLGEDYTSPRRGATMVGAAFAVDKQYFTDIGAYDEGMVIWGGENLELSWRVWLCGGQMMHVPCSHMGHIARSQPYSFPGGRRAVEDHNHKRAVDVWMGPLKKYVYQNYPQMETLDVGNITSRLEIKERLQCKEFDWYMKEIWPELLVYNDTDTVAWGSAKNLGTQECLDNYNQLFPGPLYVSTCHCGLETQGFSLTNEGLLRTTLGTVVFTGKKPELQSYGLGPKNTWTHTKDSWLRHEGSQKCLDVLDSQPHMSPCDKDKKSQMWIFNYYLE